MMKLSKNLKLVNKAIMLKDNLILSDIHIGYEEALNLKGVLLPRLQFRDIIKDLDRIFDDIPIKIKNIIIDGDLKHEFGKISETEWRHALKLIDYLKKKSERVILIKGNHDTILGPLAGKRRVKIVENMRIDDTLILHGDRIPDKKDLSGINTIIIGHEHPAITLKDGPRTEKYKCFLKGRWKRYDLIVMPSFTPVVEGSDILSEERLSPFLKNLDSFSIYIIEDKVYDFGIVRNLKYHL